MPRVRITVSAHPIKPPKIHNPKPTPPPITEPVTPPVPPTIDLTPASITVSGTTSAEVGLNVTFSATVKNATGDVLSTSIDAWHSSDTSKATIDSSGLLTVIAAGTTSITATITSPALTSNAVTFTGTAVPDPPPVADNTPASITISGGSAGIAGATAQFTAVVENASSSVLTGVQPDAWHSSNSGVATINSTGLATLVAEGGVNFTATTVSPALTSNTLAFTVIPVASVSNNEPVYREGIDTLLLSENFNYASVAAFVAQQTGSGLHLGDPEGGGAASLVTDVPAGVTGKGYRLQYLNNVFQEIHKVTTYRDGHSYATDAVGSWVDVTNGTRTLVVSDWRRITMAQALGQFDEMSIKYMEFIYPTSSNIRQLFNLGDHLPYPPEWQSGALFKCVGKNETEANGAQSYQSPTPTQLIQAGVWYHSTFVYRGHSSDVSKDGEARLWVTCPALSIPSTEVIRIRQDAVGVIPSNPDVPNGSGGFKPWCFQDDVDFLSLGNSGSFEQGVGAIDWWHNLIAATGSLTVDLAGVQIWTRP